MKKPLIRTRIKPLLAVSLGFCTLLASGIDCAQAPSSGRWVLRSAKQADRWQDAFVTGNGTHRTMVMGNFISERITNVHEELFLRAFDRSIVGVPNIAQHLAAQRQHSADGNNNAFFVYGDAINQANALGAGATRELTPHPAFDLRLDRASLAVQTGQQYELKNLFPATLISPLSSPATALSKPFAPNANSSSQP